MKLSTSWYFSPYVQPFSLKTDANSDNTYIKTFMSKKKTKFVR